MPAQKKDINLLPKEPWERGVFGKLTTWTVSVARYIIIFTELIVISGFLYRFGLDRKITELKEQIALKQEIVSSYGDLESKFRQIQKQLETVKTVETQALPVSRLLSLISQITPTETTYTDINISPAAVELNGQVLTESGLATILAKAQDVPEFENVVLENVSSGIENKQAIVFRLTLNLKKPGQL